MVKTNNTHFYKSQFGQDKFVIKKVLNYKKGGYFVDIGAYDGVHLSNTYALEKMLDWRGICVEPSKKFFDLTKNRNCLCIQAAAGPDSDTMIQFLYYGQSPALSGNISTISNHLKMEDLIGSEALEMKTVSLYDLLKKNNAPKYIDYLNIDTEGYEYEILKNFKFDEYKFGVITVEHNNNVNLKKGLYSLLKKNGYIRIAQIKCYEDWYVAPELFKIRLLNVSVIKEIDRSIVNIRIWFINQLKKKAPRFYDFLKKHVTVKP